MTAKAGSSTGTQLSGTFTNAAGTRHYEGFVPSGYRRGAPMPLVIALHGCTETAGAFRRLSHLDALAQEKGFIVVYPQQPASANPMACWNWYLNQDMRRGTGEPSIIAGITQWAQSHYTVDSNRVYLLGFSAGGAMADVMAATYPDLYAAIGIGSGIQYGGINPTVSATQAGHDVYAAMGSHSREMPVLVFQGGRDDIVDPKNATKLVEQWQTTDNLVTPNFVPSSPTKTENLVSSGNQTYTVERYRNSQGQDVLQSWLVPGMKHAWSGGCGCESYANPSGPDESAAMYQFFMDHPKPTSAWTVYKDDPSGTGWPGWPGWPGGMPGMPSFPGLNLPGWPFPIGTIPSWPFPSWPFPVWPSAARPGTAPAVAVHHGLR